MYLNNFVIEYLPKDDNYTIFANLGVPGSKK
jgi:hypothetical protein